MKSKLRFSLGFTLIEVIVVVGIIGLIMPALFAIVFGIVRQQAKVQALKQAKREGDFLLQNIGDNLRNYAVSIHSSSPPTINNIVCDSVDTSSPEPLFFQDKYGNWFTYGKTSFGKDDIKIASSSSIVGAGADLTTSSVDVEDFELSCSATSSFSPPIISIKFTILYNTDSTRVEDIGSLTYQTKVKLRSY